VKLLLDTHFLLWIVLEVPQIDDFEWLDRYRPWGVSPVSFLEVAFLSEVGRIDADTERFMEAVGSDARFIIDEVPLLTLLRRSLPLDWTRDPFDRLLVAHSGARRTPLCTLDRSIREHHGLLVRELGSIHLAVVADSP
jgi:PIN domain nuclease of toxin-antitoxin system